MQSSTISAIATAPGAGGIAIVRLSGPESYPVVERVFRPVNPNKKVLDAKGYTALFGRFVEGEETFDEGSPSFSVRRTATRARMLWSCPVMAEVLWHGGWWKPVSKQVRFQLPPASTLAVPI